VAAMQIVRHKKFTPIKNAFVKNGHFVYLEMEVRP
jgi:hypothetical protein